MEKSEGKFVLSLCIKASLTITNRIDRHESILKEEKKHPDLHAVNLRDDSE